MISYEKIIKCRLCDSKSLNKLLKLPDSPICDLYTKNINSINLYPLNLKICKDCNFVQLDTVVDPKYLYKNYIYFTKSSPTLKKHFNKYSNDIIKTFKNKKEMTILDIGSNDGTFLSFLKKHKFKVYGVEPFKKSSDYANKKGVKTFNTFFDKKFVKNFLKKYKKVNMVTINNLFANVDDLKSFMENINLIIDENGFVVIESSYLYSMIKMKIFDFIYHEHLSYLSIKPLEKFMKNFDLSLYRVVKTDSKGGSLRYFFKKNHKKNINSKNILEYKEKEVGFSKISKKFSSLNNFIISQREKVQLFLKKNNKKIYAFGASASSTTLISTYDLKNHIKIIFDENEDKVNTFSPCYNIPVKSLNQISNYEVDVLIILAWRYKDLILPKVKKYVRKKIIIPLPSFKIISL